MSQEFPMPSPADAITLQGMYESVDAVAKAMEAKWGVNRLPALVGDELRARFERQRARLSDLYREAWETDVLTRDALEALQKAVEATKRAWAAIDREATEKGCEGIQSAAQSMSATLSSGKRVCVVADEASAHHAIKLGHHDDVWSLEEIATIIEAFEKGTNGFVSDMKHAFPGAVLKRAGKAPNDAIPWD
jgi:hypothetical protein